VAYVRNFTDVDDKINARAIETVGEGGDVNGEIARITEMTTQWFLDDMGALGALEPTQMPRATQYIGQMIEMIEKLIADGHAYEAEGHVLFSVESYKKYGALSGRSVDDMIAGSRVEVAPYKRNPMDFVLWKPSSDDLPGWDSPWGRGRPGWHIECSAMSYELLGESFDIHGGGNDLMFPHHENEIAQSCCAHPEGGFAQVWMHNEMLQVEGKKMSKSLGNFFTVHDLLEQGVPGEVIQLVMLRTHYRKPVDWTEEKRWQQQKRLSDWRRLVDGVEAGEVSQVAIEALAQDLNTHAFFTEMENLYKKGDAPTLKATGEFLGFFSWERGEWFRNNPSIPLAMLGRNRKGDQADSSAINQQGLKMAQEQILNHQPSYDALRSIAQQARRLEDMLRAFDSAKASMDRSSQAVSQLLNLAALEGFDRETLAQIALIERAKAKLIDARQTAMQTKDFSEVDRLKAALVEAGVEVRMSKEGVELIPGAEFDPSKLEGLE
jgi:cysteinyl-tRNA synthetase